jgi:hypothetical protein
MGSSTVAWRGSHHAVRSGMVRRVLYCQEKCHNRNEQTVIGVRQPREVKDGIVEEATAAINEWGLRHASPNEADQQQACQDP